MMKKRIISIITAMAVAAPLLSTISVAAAENEAQTASETGDVQIYSTATLEDDFTDDVVLLSFKHECSVINKVWTPEDFPECDNIASVVDITYTDKSDEWIEDYLSKVEFRQLLALYLEETGKDKVLEAVEDLETRTDVSCVSVNSILEECATVPNDATYIEQYDPFELVDLYDAWDIETGSSSVKVGVIDSGIYAHEDLVDNLTTGFDGHSYTSNTTDAPNDHGTAVASVIGASGNNGFGMCGVAWDVTIVPLQAVKPDIGKCTLMYVAECLDWAKSNDIPIVNVSLGEPTDDPYCRNIARNYPGLIVIAAGNDSINIDSSPIYPAVYDFENIITVGACNTYGNILASSNYGTVSVDLCAPGIQVKYAVGTNEYASIGAGTSLAAPFVAGTAALLLSYNPNLTTAQLREAILGSVQPMESLEGYCATGGLLNVKNALDYVTEGDKENSYVINLYVNESSCISTASITTTYDKDILSYNSIIMGSAIPNSGYWSGSMVYDGLAICQYQNPSSSNDLIRDSGTIAKICFNSVFNLDNPEEHYTVTYSQLLLKNGNNVSETYVSEEMYLLGDVNLDGRVNAMDATMAARFAAGAITLTEPALSACDVNLSGTVDSEDATAIGQYSTGAINSFL